MIQHLDVRMVFFIVLVESTADAGRTGTTQLRSKVVGLI